MLCFQKNSTHSETKTLMFHWFYHQASAGGGQDPAVDTTGALFSTTRAFTEETSVRKSIDKNTITWMMVTNCVCYHPIIIKGIGYRVQSTINVAAGRTCAKDDSSTIWGDLQ